MKIEIPDYTIDRMWKAIEESHEDEERDYLGASLIGHDCLRYLYYVYNKYPREPFSGKTLATFESGHRSEDLAAERLKLIDGVTLITHDEDGNQYGFSDFDGKFQGHYDGGIKGISEAPKTWHVWEHKECNERKFKDFLKKRQDHGYKSVLKIWNKQYYAQAQIYMHYTKMSRHYMTVSTMGGRDYASCRTDYNKEHALEYIRKAQTVIEALSPLPQISNNPDYFVCKWCDFKDTCHGFRNNKM